jgi:nucleotide-binding universal stress UspA family protein
MTPIRVILHATDFSEPAKDAFEIATALARERRARLVVLHVAVRPMSPIPDLTAVLPEPEDYREELERRLRAQRPADPAVRVEYWLEEGDPVTEILRVARETGCDLIVMGTHGRTGLGRALLGSVAEQVLRLAPCPVLTVRMP